MQVTGRLSLTLAWIHGPYLSLSYTPGPYLCSSTCPRPFPSPRLRGEFSCIINEANTVFFFAKNSLELDLEWRNYCSSRYGAYFRVALRNWNTKPIIYACVSNY